MVDAFVQLPADGVGKKIDTAEISVSGQTVERQRMVIGDDVVADQVVRVFDDKLNVNLIGSQQFLDMFDSLDTTDRWNPAVVSNGVTAAVAASNLTIGTGTTTAGYAYITSRPSFVSTMPGYVRIGYNVTLEFPRTAQTYRYWGLGTVPGSPTTTTPITNGIGVEVTTTGVMNAVTFNAGVRTVIAVLTSFAANNANHSYEIYWSPKGGYWYIDDVLVATGSQLQTDLGVSTMPLVFMAIAGTTPGSSGTITSNGCSVSDTAKNHVQVADGVFPWRKMSIVAKNAQGTYAQATQDLKDSGRVAMTGFIDDIAGTTVDTLSTVTTWVKGGVTSSAGNYTVSAGKTLRITSFSIGVRNSGAVASSSRVRIKSAYSTAATTTASAVVAALAAGTPSATAQAIGANTIQITDGFELPAGSTLGITHIENAVTGFLTVCVTGFEY